MPTLSSLARSAVQRWCAGARQNTRFREIGKRWAIDLIEDFGLSMSDDLTYLELPMLDKVKVFLKRIIPLAKAVAAMTPTLVDDQVVAFLESWVNTPAGVTLEQHEAAMKATGALPS